MEAAVRSAALIGRNTIKIKTSQRDYCIPRELLRFNRKLSSISGELLNESDIEELMDELSGIPGRFTAIHQLLLARIMELTLVCAGNYADGCEFEAVGYLLVNPRQVDLHVRGRVAPIEKKRHARISEQLAGLMENGDPVDWLKHNTWPSIRKQALLPALYEALDAAGFMATDYLHSITHRMCQISSTVAFLSAWQIDSTLTLHKKLEIASRNTKTLLADHLCRFDLSFFETIGQEVVDIAAGKTTCRFLHKDIAGEYIRQGESEVNLTT